MISKTTRHIAVLAALLCTSAATAQENRGPPSRGPRARPTLSGSARSTFPTPPESSTG
jgi:hypothetical protein